MLDKVSIDSGVRDMHKLVPCRLVDRVRSTDQLQIAFSYIVCPDGGIGRRARLRGVWATVRVQVPLRTDFFWAKIIGRFTYSSGEGGASSGRALLSIGLYSIYGETSAWQS